MADLAGVLRDLVFLHSPRFTFAIKLSLSLLMVLNLIAVTLVSFG